MAAPKGNHNALKHGLYATHFSPQTLARIRQMSPLDLQQEISLMRVAVKNLFELHNRLFTEGPKDPEEFRKITNSLSLAVATLTTAVRANVLFQAQNSSQNNSISSAMENLPVFLEDDYLSCPDLASERPPEILVHPERPLPASNLLPASIHSSAVKKRHRHARSSR